MNKLNLISIDTAKSVFHVVGWGREGQACVRRQLSRAQLEKFMSQQPPTRVVMEACGGSHHWGRRFGEMGHRVQLIAAQFVTPYRRGQKNDYQDAVAIGVAAQAPGMRYVGVKGTEQQAVEALHRVRSGKQAGYVALSNQLRGLLAEHGCVFGKGEAALRRGVVEVLAAGKLPAVLAEVAGELMEELRERAAQVKKYEQRIKAAMRNAPSAQAMQAELDGVGTLTASALVCKVADPRVFDNGRQFAAYVGLVPRQHSTGGKTQLGALTKAGDVYIRALLIHGARAVLRHLGDKQDEQSRWLRGLVERRGYNKACVALAHRNARRAWAIMVKHAA